MSQSEYVPRMTLTLRQDQVDDLRVLIDWGLRSKLFEPVVDDLIEMLKRDRANTIALLLSRDIKLSHYLKRPDDGND